MLLFHRLASPWLLRALLLAAVLVPAGASRAANAPRDHASATSSAPAPVTGQSLYRLVERYTNLGDHRTGSDADAATLAWFAAELQQHGALVERRSFGFPRYDAQVDVRIGGLPVPALPLFYEGVGDVSDDHPFVAAVPVLDNDRPTRALLDEIAKAKAAGARILIVATLNATGELQTPNRVPALGSGLPVILVPGRSADALLTGPVQVNFSGRIEPGESANIVAAFGDVRQAPIVIATPLSGWFGAAAERGTGVAIAIALAERLAKRHAVLVVGSPGHELLPHIGLSAFLKTTPLAPSLVIHLGANVALGARDASGHWALIGTRAIGARMGQQAFDAWRPALESLGVKPFLNPPKWLGEGALWADAVASPMVSFVGIGPQFHSPADIPLATTSPALLQQVFDALAQATDAWLALPAGAAR